MNKPICKPINVLDEVHTDLKGWLEKQAEWLKNQAKDPKENPEKEYHLYLLAHADDGVIWGEFRGENYQLITSGDDDIFPQFPKLRPSTLQQCRIFCQNAEVMLWKIDQNCWKARLIKDDHLSKEDYISEKQILWGTQVEKESKNFSLVSDGSQGLRHAVPLPNIKDKFKDGKRPLRLTIHHYIDYDESGVARIDLSRLVDLTTKEKNDD
jgi:CRISPR-associated protein (TIGR03984 family)